MRKIQNQKFAAGSICEPATKRRRVAVTEHSELSSSNTTTTSIALEPVSGNAELDLAPVSNTTTTEENGNESYRQSRQKKLLIVDDRPGIGLRIASPDSAEFPWSVFFSPPPFSLPGFPAALKLANRRNVTVSTATR